MMYADLAVRFHYRELAIRALADSGLKIHTYGEGYNYIECNYHENIIEHGGVDSKVCLDMISQAKISLNVMPWFKKGAHDRVFNTMLNGVLRLLILRCFTRIHLQMVKMCCSIHLRI